MSEAKFTKGEWKFSSMAVGLVDNSDTQSYGMLQQLCWIEGDFCQSEEEVRANAHLIAAAPEMYKMLNSLSEMMPMLDEQTHPQIEMDSVKYDIDRLLAKARGEQ